MKHFLPIILLLQLIPTLALGQSNADKLFARENLVAWCIVPFDSRARGPEERAEMMRRLELTHFAYDWRAEHLPTYESELDILKNYGIELTALWFPGALNAEAKILLDGIENRGLHPQLWVSSGATSVEQTRAEIEPIAREAKRLGCKVALYNHGGWFGEPENQIQVIRALNMDNVGIVYNLHHGHGHLDRFEKMLKEMLPHLLCLNLNGMVRDGEAKGQKILPLGQGDEDLRLLRTIQKSGYTGPIGIIGHTMDDVELRLRDNLDGLDWLVPQLDGTTEPKPKPSPRTMAPHVQARGEDAGDRGRALRGGMVVDEIPEHRQLPITVACRARLDSAANFNILVASDTKASGDHWEIFTTAGAGALTLYIPGYAPDHIRTDKVITDGKWRGIVLQFEPTRARLYLNGELVADQSVARGTMPAVASGLAFGRLVEGGIGCDGLVDDVRVWRGLVVPARAWNASAGEATLLGSWNFDDLPLAATTLDADAWEIESASVRESMPERWIIPATHAHELTPAAAVKKNSANWPRSNGDDASTRFSSLDQINRTNIARLKPAWTYHSGDKASDRADNIQCAPVCVNGVLYVPTVGDAVVAIDGATGKELWRFKPEGRPAHRGLVYWDDDANHDGRLFVHAGNDLWCINAKSGKPISHFGEGGRISIGAVTVAGAVFQSTYVYAALAGGVFGVDTLTGERRWTFNTIPQSGEFGADTWRDRGDGANCWGGMSLDPERGIAFVSTGSPKPNFYGGNHEGSNLFANCVIALDALTGKRLWHFQELRHDIWDLDLAAPPNLVSINVDGRAVDAVAQLTKTGNTLLLDRVTGRPIFDVPMRRAPASLLPGERTWPYQPDIARPEPFSRQTFSLDDVTTRSQDARDHVMKMLNRARMGWRDAFEEGKPTVFYGLHGGAEWTGAAFDPDNGRLYVTANELPWIVTMFPPDGGTRPPGTPPTRGEEVYTANCASCHGADRIGVGMAPPLQSLARRLNDDQVRELVIKGSGPMPAAEPMSETDMNALLDYLFLRDRPANAPPPATPARPNFISNGYPKLLDHEGYPGIKPPWGTLNCLDLASGKIIWRVPLGEYPDLAENGLRGTGAENFGGATVTAGGLVFAAGTPDLKIRAFDSDTGEELWSHALPWGGYAPPAVYEANGKQYVVIAATGGGKLGGEMGDAWVAFALE